jgi:hypothetical protein
MGDIETLAVTAPEKGSNVIHLPFPTNRSDAIRLGAAFAAPTSSVLEPEVMVWMKTMLGAAAGGTAVGPKTVCVVYVGTGCCQ